MNNSIPRRLQTLREKLEFLAQITPGVKPNVSDMALTDASSWVGSFVRGWWYKESRKTTLNHIKDIVSETVDEINNHQDSEFLLCYILDILPSAREGINSLKTTYRDDTKMVSEINVQLKNLDLQIDIYKTYIKGYQKPGTSRSFSKSEEHDVSIHISDNNVSKSNSSVNNLSRDVSADIKHFVTGGNSNSNEAPSVHSSRRHLRRRKHTSSTSE